jgi:hypothetical protein
MISSPLSMSAFYLRIRHQASGYRPQEDLLPEAFPIP